MVALRERGVSPSMAIDAGGVWLNPAARRGTLATYKFRVREERKKVIRISNAKYRKIDDHESGLRRFVLIRNTLRRLQREAREEKLARHRALAANVSPSYLSASRPRSPSPPCDMQVSDVLSVYGQPTPTPITALDEDDPMPAPKRPRLFLDDDKENDGMSCESRLECDLERKDDSRMIVDDTQEILRDLYETYTGESLSQTTTSSRPGTPTPPRPDTPYTASYSCTLPSTTPSLATTNTNNSSNNNSNGFNNNTTSGSISSTGSGSSNSSTTLSSYHDWSRPQQQQQYACGHASLLGNDLQSVVFHSLIASLES
ncbi:uncharacterized protein [Macrobrachium rosenbergii]|uniref:uncharacterized protein isoform X1 n=2 Tax=Macrobrachium rosenbergii TaxID=79674 RepID=UPI0034D477DD